MLLSTTRAPTFTPMDRERMHRIGRLGKPWGHRGELSVHLEVMAPDEIAPDGPLFVDIDGQLVPFFFTHLHQKGRETLVKFDEVDDPQAASALVGRDLLLPASALGDQAGLDWEPDELIGLTVRDEEHGTLGTVTEIAGTPQNPVMVIHDGTHEIMVPVANEMIVEVDEEERTLLVRTPPGLVDLYRTP